MQKFYFLIAFLGITNLLLGQISFKNANDRLQNSGVHSGVAIAVLDMNGDGLDDIVRLSGARFLMIEYQSRTSALFDSYSFETLSNSNQWSMVAADVDNNGYCDVLTGGAYDGVKLVKADASGTSFELSQLPGNGLFVQGSNLVDINNDGFLDYFACHDDAESRIWANDGTGNFINADEWIDMAVNPNNNESNSGNYGSIWTDFDNDGDIDLYIAKCRQGVDSSTDPRRINMLFVNDGMGNFVEAAEASNLKIGAQSWTADFQDIDNDGDYDCFITNHDVPSMLLENDGTGVFTDITASSGLVIGGLAIQGVMRDFDNDGFVDVLVSGTQQYLYRNNGDKTFSLVEGVFSNNDMESFAIGDLNHDGYLDIYAGYADLYTSPSNIDDVLWLNEGAGNNFITFNLIGTQSNRSAVGARVELYGDWGMQVREVRAGESYGIMNSLHQHFGIGQSTSVDSVIIKWPSGIIDTHTNLEANQFITLIEGTCISPTNTISSNGEGVFCEGESVELTAGIEGEYDYLWNTGDTTASITVTEAGIYNLILTDENDCFSVSQNIELSLNPDETPVLSFEGDTVFCQGGSVMLISSEAMTYEWSNGATGQAIEVSEEGEYTVTIEGLCESFTSAPISVNVLEAPVPELEGYDVVATDVTIDVSGTNILWYDEEDAIDPIAAGNQLVVSVENDTTLTYYAESTTLYSGGAYSVGMLEHEGASYSGNQYNGGIIFDCTQPFALKTVKVYTDTEGPRLVELQTESGEVLQSKEVFIPEGEHIITLDFQVEPGENLFLTTNEDFNLDNFGYESARLQRSNQGVNYPYVVDDVLSMTTSNYGAIRYYYFFDWQIKLDDVACTSERIDVSVVVVDTDELEEAGEIQLSPNPTTNFVQIEWPNQESLDAYLMIRNLNGQTLKQASINRNNNTIDISSFPAGVYFFEIREANRIYISKLIKQ